MRMRERSFFKDARVEVLGGEKDNDARRKTFIGKETIRMPPWIVLIPVLVSVLVFVLVFHDLLSSTGVALVDCSLQSDWLLA